MANQLSEYCGATKDGHTCALPDLHQSWHVCADPVGLHAVLGLQDEDDDWCGYSWRPAPIEVAAPAWADDLRPTIPSTEPEPF